MIAGLGLSLKPSSPPRGLIMSGGVSLISEEAQIRPLVER